MNERPRPPFVEDAYYFSIWGAIVVASLIVPLLKFLEFI